MNTTLPGIPRSICRGQKNRREKSRQEEVSGRPGPFSGSGAAAEAARVDDSGARRECPHTPSEKTAGEKTAGEKTAGCSARRTRGSMTVEASLLLPLLLLTLYLFWQFFGVMILHVRMQNALDETTAELAEQAYLIDAAEGVFAPDDGGLSFPSVLEQAGWRAYARSRIVSIVGKDSLKASPMRGRFLLTGSRWDRSGDVCLKVSYKLKFRGLPGKLPGIRVQQASLRKCWTGTQVGGDDEGEDGDSGEYVFVAKTGRVYHRDINCSYLNPDIRSISSSSVGGARNRSGAKYYPCEYCARHSSLPGTVFVTKYGSRYHVTRSCSELRRTIRSVRLSEISLPPCSKCAKKSGS